MMPGMQGMPQQMPGMMQATGGPGLQQQPVPGMMGPPPPGHEGVGQPDQAGGGAYHYYGHQQQQKATLHVSISSFLAFFSLLLFMHHAIFCREGRERIRGESLRVIIQEKKTSLRRSLSDNLNIT